jgi:hypothetical protein
LARGVPVQGVVVEGVKGVKFAPKPPGMYENSEKNRRFLALIALKIAQNAVFYRKLLLLRSFF